MPARPPPPPPCILIVLVSSKGVQFLAPRLLHALYGGVGLAEHRGKADEGTEATHDACGNDAHPHQSLRGVN